MLVVAAACYGYTFGMRAMQSVVQLIAYCNAHGIPSALELITHDPILPRAHAQLAARFLRRSEARHILFVAPDVGFTAGAVMRALRFDRDVVGAMVPQTEIAWDATAERRRHRGASPAEAPIRFAGEVCRPLRAEKGFWAAEEASCGFLLVRRSVFERMQTAYPELRCRCAQGGEMAEMYALFDGFVDAQTGAHYDDDAAFCRRWRRIGGEIWLDGQSGVCRCGGHDFFAPAASRFASVVTPS